MTHIDNGLSFYENAYNELESIRLLNALLVKDNDFETDKKENAIYFLNRKSAEVIDEVIEYTSKRRELRK
ncbi:hypothetical protein [Campylobacter ureolyticus]|uniref:hypothetical protein n=1 Tax=Campylobacter ureolyticus TaxID=827 RepID=UPI000467FBE7|nr:hypothetical protein [Campylobacter ureolyticus]MCZ6135541.1 hypothetical protein [Campylobacter ureolyticus]QIX86595.1 hypothetical protein FOB81_04585 [Campylobacter ureolyticus]STA71118.1 Uncharacterised protein [Campylobacter ureolyticus]